MLCSSMVLWMSAGALVSDSVQWSLLVSQSLIRASGVLFGGPTCQEGQEQDSSLWQEGREWPCPVARPMASNATAPPSGPPSLPPRPPPSPSPPRYRFDYLLGEHCARHTPQK